MVLALKSQPFPDQASGTNAALSRTEVMVMARAALHSHHELAIAMPIAIAIVAMGRYMVVSSDHNALHQMMYAGAIFILVAALFLWKMRVRLTGWSAGKDNAD